MPGEREAITCFFIVSINLEMLDRLRKQTLAYLCDEVEHQRLIEHRLISNSRRGSNLEN